MSASPSFAPIPNQRHQIPAEISQHEILATISSQLESLPYMPSDNATNPSKPKVFPRKIFNFSPKSAPNSPTENNEGSHLFCWNSKSNDPLDFDGYDVKSGLQLDELTPETIDRLLVNPLYEVSTDLCSVDTMQNMIGERKSSTGSKRSGEQSTTGHKTPNKSQVNKSPSCFGSVTDVLCGSDSEASKLPPNYENVPKAQSARPSFSLMRTPIFTSTKSQTNLTTMYGRRGSLDTILSQFDKNLDNHVRPIEVRSGSVSECNRPPNLPGNELSVATRRKSVSSSWDFREGCFNSLPRVFVKRDSVAPTPSSINPSFISKSCDTLSSEVGSEKSKSSDKSQGKSFVTKLKFLTTMRVRSKTSQYELRGEKRPSFSGFRKKVNPAPTDDSGRTCCIFVASICGSSFILYLPFSSF